MIGDNSLNLLRSCVQRLEHVLGFDAHPRVRSDTLDCVQKLEQTLHARHCVGTLAMSLAQAFEQRQSQGHSCASQTVAPELAALDTPVPFERKGILEQVRGHRLGRALVEKVLPQSRAHRSTPYAPRDRDKVLHREQWRQHLAVLHELHVRCSGAPAAAFAILIHSPERVHCRQAVSHQHVHGAEARWREACEHARERVHRTTLPSRSELLQLIEEHHDLSFSVNLRPDAAPDGCGATWRHRLLSQRHILINELLEQHQQLLPRLVALPSP
mmetsp:Transcript_870/g.3218  ORF Transcript_870/g.3218 Transcript_870/m.3218 type:complete len:271 (-) Transcript_870:1012-1824(-)